MGNNNSSGIIANNYYFPGYTWPSSFLTSATKRANVQSRQKSRLYLLKLSTRQCKLLSNPLHFPASSTPQRPTHFRRLASDSKLLSNSSHSEAVIIGVLNICAIKK